MFSSPEFLLELGQEIGSAELFQAGVFCREGGGESVKKIGGEMLTKSYKIRSLINFRILNEPKAAEAVEGLCWRSHFLWQSGTLTGSAKL